MKESSSPYAPLTASRPLVAGDIIVLRHDVLSNDRVEVFPPGTAFIVLDPSLYPPHRPRAATRNYDFVPRTHYTTHLGRCESPLPVARLMAVDREIVMELPSPEMIDRVPG